jgi:hypothetical protein
MLAGPEGVPLVGVGVGQLVAPLAVVVALGWLHSGFIPWTLLGVEVVLVV